MDAEISLESRPLSDRGTKFVWRNIQGPVVHHNSLFDPVRIHSLPLLDTYLFLFILSLLYGKQNPPTTRDHCVFIRGFRAKRCFFRIKVLRAAAEPRPDDPDNHKDDGIQMERVPGVPKVGGLLMWVMKKYA